MCLKAEVFNLSSDFVIMLFFNKLRVTNCDFGMMDYSKIISMSCSIWEVKRGRSMLAVFVGFVHS